MENDRLKVTTQAVATLDTKWVKTVAAIYQSPARYLNDKLTALRPQTREFVSLALIRMAYLEPQEAALEALNAGDAATLEMRDQYLMRRNYIVGSLNELGLTCHLPRGSFYAFPSIASTGLTSREFAVGLLQEEKVACVPGGAFGACGESYVRCCFATAFDQIQTAMDRMGRFVERARARQ
jgi:aspartate/methionine/tyrosine aminotransferase